MIILGPNKTSDYEADIKLVTIHGTDYIKTDSNPIPCDKIGTLPEYYSDSMILGKNVHELNALYLPTCFFHNRNDKNS